MARGRGPAGPDGLHEVADAVLAALQRPDERQAGGVPESFEDGFRPGAGKLFTHAATISPDDEMGIGTFRSCGRFPLRAVVAMTGLRAGHLAWRWFAASLTLFLLGLVLAAAWYPVGFDWQYTVISRLASRKHNPDGSLWFSIGLAVSVLLLWPVMEHIRPRGPGPWSRTATLALRAGLVFAALVGVERTLFVHLSSLVDKGHEALALLAFLSLYVGLLAAYAQRVASGAAGRCRALAGMSPLVLVGLGSFGLYVLQRDIGWVKPNWRDLGVPLWQSFAFWQWLMVVVMWSAVAHLLATARARS